MMTNIPAYVAWLCLALGFSLGVAIGMAIEYLRSTRPLFADYRKLVWYMYKMKKQGFVPQYDIEHPQPNDPSSDVIEY